MIMKVDFSMWNQKYRTIDATNANISVSFKVINSKKTVKKNKKKNKK